MSIPTLRSGPEPPAGRSLRHWPWCWRSLSRPGIGTRRFRAPNPFPSFSLENSRWSACTSRSIEGRWRRPKVSQKQGFNIMAWDPKARELQPYVHKTCWVYFTYHRRQKRRQWSAWMWWTWAWNLPSLDIATLGLGVSCQVTGMKTTTSKKVSRLLQRCLIRSSQSTGG